MVERRRVATTAPARPVLDKDAVMLALTARQQAIRPLAAGAVRLKSTGENERGFIIGDTPIAGSSFGAVCQFLDVPTSFMHRAPLDLVNQIAKRMLKEPRAAESELIFNSSTQAIVGYRPKGQRSVPAVQVFDKIFSNLPATEGIYLHQNERAVEASIVCKSLTIEPKKGDIVRGGLQCLYSEVDSKRAIIRAYSERLVCTNGMTHRDFDHEFGVPDDIDEFLREIGVTVRACREHVEKVLEPKLRRATEFQVNGPQAIRRIFRQARLAPKYLDAVLAAHAIEDDGTAFGVLQAFTRAANLLGYEARTKLQLVAGDELTVVEKAHCPSCYSPL